MGLDEVIAVTCSGTMCPKGVDQQLADTFGACGTGKAAAVGNLRCFLILIRMRTSFALMKGVSESGTGWFHDCNFIIVRSQYGILIRIVSISA